MSKQIIKANISWTVPVTISVDLTDEHQTKFHIQSALVKLASIELMNHSISPEIKDCIELPYVNT